MGRSRRSQGIECLAIFAALSAALLDIAAPAAQSAQPLAVGLVFSVGGLGDASFNDSAHEGLQRAKRDFGIEALEYEPVDASQREPLARRLAVKADLIFGVGLFFSDDFIKLAAQFPARKFAVVDFVGDEQSMPANLLGIRFREQEGAFLVGAAAALAARTDTVGFVGGMDSPLIRKFEAGYRAGVKAARPGMRVVAAYAGVTGQAFADPAKGAELAKAQFDAGADIIFQAAGTTGFGVFKAAEERGRRAIGVDADQSHMAKPGVIVTSMLKNTSETVYRAIDSFTKGEWQGGIREFGLAENAIDYVANDANLDVITPEIRQRVEAFRAAIVAGEIQVPVDPKSVQ